jgi:hypothetical protein
MSRSTSLVPPTNNPKRDAILDGLATTLLALEEAEPGVLNRFKELLHNRELAARKVPVDVENPIRPDVYFAEGDKKHPVTTWTPAPIGADTFAAPLKPGSHIQIGGFM